LIYPRFRLYSNLKNYLDTLFYKSKEEKRDYKSDLEQTLISKLGIGHVLVTNQARLAIYHVIKYLVEKTGKKGVILSPYTLFDVVNMIICAGGQPIFIDFKEISFDLNEKELENKLISGEICATIVTHYHKCEKNIQKIADICRNYKTSLIEDCAISFGGKSSGQYLGTIGDYGIFSFGRMKNISAYYGGALVTNDSEMVTTIRKEIDDYPVISKKRLISALIFNLAIETITSPVIWSVFFHHFFVFGYKKKIDLITMLIRPDKNMQLFLSLPEIYKRQISTLQCKIILDQLDSVEKHQINRCEKSSEYFTKLNMTDGIRHLNEDIDYDDPYLEYPILVSEREKIFFHLLGKGVDCRKYYYRNCANLRIFSKYHASCPNVEYIENHIILLSVYPKYPKKIVEKTISLIKSVA